LRYYPAAVSSGLLTQALGRMHRLINLLSVVLFTASLVACVPIRVMQQPQVSFHVADPSGQPISSATVHFARYSIHPFNPIPKSLFAFEATTENSGSAFIREQFEWQTAFVGPDGGPAHYGWAWCIDKPGFAPEFNNTLREPVPPVINVVLRQAVSAAKCPAATDDGYRIGP